MPVVARATVDPSIGVMQIIGALQCHLNRMHTTDLESSLAVPDRKPWGWKRALNPSWMIALCPLAYDLVKVASNAVLPSKKVKLAIHKLIDQRKVTVKHSKREVVDCIDTCDQMIRIFLSQFRKAKQDRDSYMSLVRRMSESEKRALDEVLSILDLTLPGAEAEENPVAAVGETALVPYNPSSSSTPPAISALPSSSASKQSIFRRILSKEPSSPWNDKNFVAPMAKDTGFDGMHVSKQDVQKKSVAPFGGMFVGKPWSSSSSEAEQPPNKKDQIEKGSTQNDFLFADEAQALEAALKQDYPKIRMKRPAAACAKPACKKPAADLPATKQGSPKKGKGKKNTMCKSSFRHRKTSSAYHKAKKEALAAGKTNEDAKECARLACQKVGAEIDAGLIQEL